VSALVAAKLAALLGVVAAGWGLGRLQWLGSPQAGRVFGAAAIHLFIPALLLRTALRADLAALPWRTLAAVFVPLLALMLAGFLWARRDAAAAPAAPATRGIALAFGNTIQVGIPLASAVFGPAGLAIHITIVSVYALVLLTAATTLAELALARRRGGPLAIASTLGATVRATVIHPVVLPVLCGLALNLAGVRLPAAVDEWLALLASAVVPVCLMAIGLSLAEGRVAEHWRAALAMAAGKLVVTPLVVLAFAGGVMGLRGLALAVVVMLAALPVGSNVLIFAQRYRVLEAEVAAAVVLSTLAFAVTAPGWLLVLASLGAL
jgi:malonate transporter